MRDRKQIGEEILDHLQLYREIGIRWTCSEQGAAGHRSQPDGNTTAVPGGSVSIGSGVRKPPAAPQFLVPIRSMFDDLPGVQESLDIIRADLGDCRRCKLAFGRQNIVFGSGSPNAELMFVGEAPGADEDQQGLPFVGRAGQLLTKIIEAIGMRREEVYICNILKCRPSGNRNPEPDEISACEPFLLRQIASVKPKVICALGTFGAQTLLRTKEPISRLRGYFIDYRGGKLMATFHPAYLLRNPNEKRKVWEDVQKIRDYLRSLRSGS
jgi:uracil-DNA glycosylase